MAVLGYMATPEYANLRQKTQTAELDGGLSGFLSAAQGRGQVGVPAARAGLPGDPQRLQAVPVRRSRPDAGSRRLGSFWTEGTSAVNGDEDAQKAADNIEATWPS